jgi:hypothetical protein
MKSTLTVHEHAFLRAAADLSRRQVELYDVLARAIRVDPYTYWFVDRLRPEQPALLERIRRWIQRRRIDGGMTSDGAWRWNFHGLECDMRNVKDGRTVRIDFGPKSHHLVLTGWGVLQYVMSVVPPWQTYDELRDYLAQSGPPYDHLSGDHAKMSWICDRLEALGLLVPAAPELLALRKAYTKRDPETGIKVIDIPADATDSPSRDFYVCERLVLSTQANELLGAGGPTAGCY